VHDLERATLLAASEQAGVPRYRVANVVLAEDMDAIADAMIAGHRAAKEAIKARRPDLPVGLSLAMIDDQVVGDDASVRDRKRAEVYGRWLALVREDDFLGVQNYARAEYDGTGLLPPPPGAALDQMGAEIYPPSLAGAVRYAHSETGVPVLGYVHWALLDNFEWVFGYEYRFGLHEVDRQTFARRAKPSAAVYSAIARAGAVGG
jgi:beta-glucosidase